MQLGGTGFGYSLAISSLDGRLWKKYRYGGGWGATLSLRLGHIHRTQLHERAVTAACLSRHSCLSRLLRPRQFGLIGERDDKMDAGDSSLQRPYDAYPPGRMQEGHSRRMGRPPQETCQQRARYRSRKFHQNRHLFRVFFHDRRGYSRDIPLRLTGRQIVRTTSKTATAEWLCDTIAKHVLYSSIHINTQDFSRFLYGPQSVMTALVRGPSHLHTYSDSLHVFLMR